MNWMTLEDVKDHLRIDFDDDDALLSQYCEAAEQAVLNVCNRSFNDIVKTYGSIPQPLHMACQLLIDSWYQYRTPISGQTLSVVPYSFDILVKPYMIL